MTHLRRYLEQTGTLAPEHLDAALRRQQIYGGSLDTVLLELGICDPHTLSELLSQACKLPVAPVDLLDNGLERPWNELPEELIDIGWAVPLLRAEGSILVGIHPDLPDERLGALYRRVKNVQPLVTPECAIEKITAERTASVVPQRYAILCAAYVSALRRRPSVSDVGFPLIPGLAPSEDTSTGPPPAAPPAATDPSATLPPVDEQPDDEVTTPRGVALPPSAESQDETYTVTGVPDYVETDGPRELTPNKPPRGRVVPPGPVRAPPVRFTARGTMISTSQRLEARFEEAEAHRKMAGARELLAQAQTRDVAIDALLRAAKAITPRIGLFRIKGEGLHGMATMRSALPDISGATVSLAAPSPMHDLLESNPWIGTTADSSLQAALQLELPIPCVLVRIDVAQRPVLALYADHGGREFLPTEVGILENLCEAASETFENILRSKRRPSAPAATESRQDERPTEPPVPSTADTDAGWGPALPAARAALESDPASTSPRLPAEKAGVGPSTRRDTHVDGSTSRSEETDRKTPILTVSASPVPPPPIPPPPPMGRADGDDSRGPDTLMGLPPPSGGVSPRFIPPPLDDRENSGIISLASPIDQPSARGRIELDDDDWSHRDENKDDNQESIDEAIDALVRGEGDIENLTAFGDAGLARLTAQFPGPLEVLRRDLRALPPPSAHGPYIRTALRLGIEIVPYLLELFPHPDPDVRFYAAFIFQELRDPRCMLPLSRLAFDGSGDVRVISMRVLETYSRHPEFSDAVSIVRTELDSNNRTRQLYAARAVGTLRDVEAILQLVELLSSKDRFIQEAALESLCSITGQQHGLKPHRWRSWYGEHGHEHRLEWIISSLQHRDLPVRRWAHDELIRVTGHRIPFSPLGDKRSREVAAQAWADWWVTVGRGRFGSPSQTETSAGA